MLTIIEGLLECYPAQSLVGELCSLLSREVNSSKELTPRIALYYRMTRQQLRPKLQNINKLTERLKGLSKVQK